MTAKWRSRAARSRAASASILGVIALGFTLAQAPVVWRNSAGSCGPIRQIYLRIRTSVLATETQKHGDREKKLATNFTAATLRLAINKECFFKESLMGHGFTWMSRILTDNRDPCFFVASVKIRVPSECLASTRDKLC